MRPVPGESGNPELDAKLEQVAKEITLSVAEIEALPSPRVIRTHLHLPLLPPSLLDTSKVSTVPFGIIRRFDLLF